LRLHNAKKETLTAVTKGLVKVKGWFQREVEFLSGSAKDEDTNANGDEEHHGFESSVCASMAFGPCPC
jgi:hypothetical protein